MIAKFVANKLNNQLNILFRMKLFFIVENIFSNFFQKLNQLKKKNEVILLPICSFNLYVTTKATINQQNL